MNTNRKDTTTTKLPPLEWRTVPVTPRTLEVLGEHALTLQDGHPVRAIATLLMERYEQGEPYRFATPDVPEVFPGTGEEWAALMEAA